MSDLLFCFWSLCLPNLMYRISKALLQFTAPRWQSNLKQMEEPAMNKYSILEASNIIDYISKIDAFALVLEPYDEETNKWTAEEIGDGNLNLIFIIKSKYCSVVVKQALPYLRLVGPSWPLSIDRSKYEWKQMKIVHPHVGELIPRPYHFEKSMAFIAMEHLSKHIILRKGLIQSTYYSHLADHISTYMAESLFKTSDLYLKSSEKKILAAEFMQNELAQITENVVFTEPFKDHPNNRWNSPYLDDEVANIRKNQNLIAHVMALKEKFQTQHQALLHGDLHTGSIMVTEQDTKVIDPEFSMFGPMGFDIGTFIANLFLSFFSQDGHAKNERDERTRKEYKRSLLFTLDAFWSKFSTKFKKLWNEQHKGDGYVLLKGHVLQETQSTYLMNVFQDSIGFAGVEMIRRIIGIAHVEDFESISDLQLRAQFELNALKFAQQLILKRGEYTSLSYLFFAHGLQDDR